MKTGLLAALLALALGVGAVTVAVAEGGGAGDVGQGTRPDVLGSRVDGISPAFSNPSGFSQGPLVRANPPAGCTFRRNGTLRCPRLS